MSNLLVTVCVVKGNLGERNNEGLHFNSYVIPLCYPFKMYYWKPDDDLC